MQCIKGHEGVWSLVTGWSLTQVSLYMYIVPDCIHGIKVNMILKIYVKDIPQMQSCSIVSKLSLHKQDHI